jgi:endonuclease/exonuclease/phosphatase family metal-dependent hydrolase
MGGVASSANGLLSKLEPRLVEDHPLPGRVRGRGVLTAAFGEGPDALTVAVAHLSLGSQSRRSQIDFIADLLARLPHAVLMGDFNCDPEQPEMQALYRKTQLQPPERCVPTFPSWRPQRAIDHMLVTPALAVAAMQALPAAQSDHLALSVELDVPEAALR